MKLSLNRPIGLLIISVLFLWAFSVVSTQASHCGNIIVGEVITEIVDCDNPFLAELVPYPFNLKIDDIPVNADDIVFIPETGTDMYTVEDDRFFTVGHFYYLHEGDDYRLVDTEIPSLTEADYRRFALEFFEEGIDYEIYVQFLLGNPEGRGDPSWDWNLLDGFERYARQNFEPVIPKLLPGTYTLVSEEYQVFPTKRQEDILLDEVNRSFLKRLANLFIPVAHAQFPANPIYTLTFTLEAEQVEPAGASNVLFIPGIMGSRLYEVGDFCDGEDVDSEQELWFSTDECKQLRITTKFTGQSDNKIYTKTNDEGVFDDAFYFINIYDSFLESLRGWEDENLINNHAVFPYDWRLSLDDILKSKFDSATGKTFPGVETKVTGGLLYKLIEQLSTSSKNGKVTIVAHSNGGLVIKQLISHLQILNDPLLAKIDALVLVAVPQLGAPNSAVGILHGEELNRVMKQKTTRQLINNMPFSYHLLPTAEYFDTVSIPPVTIESGISTDEWKDTFGEEFTSQEQLHNFLSRDSGRTKPEIEDLATPEVSDPFLLHYAETAEVMQGNFGIPDGIKVYQVAGTGLSTPSQLTYFTDRGCVSRTFFLCTEYAPKIGYRVVMTVDGDATVLVPSALALPETANIERWWVDIGSYNTDGFFGLTNSNREHKNIFEISEIIEFVEDTVKGQSRDYEYIQRTQPATIDGDRLVFQLHSPLDLSIKTGSGLVVSSTTNEVSGAMYRRYGELQYITLPRTEDVELILTGQASGSFTLDIEEWLEGEFSKRVTMSGIPVSTSSSVSLIIERESLIEELLLSLDYDGDGVVDVEYDGSGTIIEEGITYRNLVDAIKGAELNRGPETLLLVLAKTAERFAKKSEFKPRYEKLEHKTLKALIKQSILYKKLRLLTVEEQEKIQNICEALINN